MTEPFVIESRIMSSCPTGIVSAGHYVDTPTTGRCGCNRMNRAILDLYRLGTGHRGDPSGNEATKALTRDFVGFRSGDRFLQVTEGYEFMEAGAQTGWHTLASWGNDGWDLGSWPYVVFMTKGPKVGERHDAEPGPFLLVQHVEGDLDFWSFPTNAIRRDALTYLFVWYAVAAEKDWARNLAGEPWDREDDRTWPAYVKGPYGFLEPNTVLPVG